VIRNNSFTRFAGPFFVLLCAALLVWCGSNFADAQGMGMATGNGQAAPAKPLPPGMKAPVVDYRDIAAQAGLTGINVSGATKNKQYIIETTGTGVAIFDYDNDGLPDIFVMNGGRLDGGLAPTHYLYHNLGWTEI